VLQDPSVRGMEPRQGPIDGRTLVTLFGDKLNTGEDQSVQFAGQRCNASRCVSYITAITHYYENAAIN